MCHTELTKTAEGYEDTSSSSLCGVALTKLWWLAMLNCQHAFLIHTDSHSDDKNSINRVQLDPRLSENGPVENLFGSQ